MLYIDKIFEIHKIANVGGRHKTFFLPVYITTQDQETRQTCKIKLHHLPPLKLPGLSDWNRSTLQAIPV